MRNKFVFESGNLSDIKNLVSFGRQLFEDSSPGTHILTLFANILTIKYHCSSIIYST